jgi:hypothetical protein
MGREQYLLHEPDNKAINGFDPNRRWFGICENKLSSRNPTQQKEHPSGLEPGRDGYIYILNFLNMLHTLHFFLFKMPFIS